jgi:aryl-alcohol dehydrogenase-like predicted oxidoreductase
LLSGKYRVTADGIQTQSGGGRLDNPDMQQFAQSYQRTNDVIETLASISKETGRSSAEVALAWLRHRPDPIIPIVGARRLDQLEANLSILDIKLDSGHLQRLDEASRIELGFPHHFFDKPMVRGLVFGGTADLIDDLGKRVSA